MDIDMLAALAVSAAVSGTCVAIRRTCERELGWA